MIRLIKKVKESHRVEKEAHEKDEHAHKVTEKDKLNILKDKNREVQLTRVVRLSLAATDRFFLLGSRS